MRPGRRYPQSGEHNGGDPGRRSVNRFLETAEARDGADGRRAAVRGGANRTVLAEGRSDEHVNRLADMVRRDRSSLRTHDTTENEINQSTLPGTSCPRTGGIGGWQPTAARLAVTPDR